MRILLIIAAVLLVAGCSQTTGRQTAETMPTLTPSRPVATAPTTTSTSRAAATAPAEGASIDDVIAFVEAGQPVDEANFHQAVRDGEVRQLAGVAFTTPTAKTRCATGETSIDQGQLLCLTTLADPPPEPTVAHEGPWVPGWITYSGEQLKLGEIHGDPGIFTYGDGSQLQYGESLRFGDYRCRMDTLGVFCVNYAQRSAARISDAGVLPFGCLQPVQPEIGGEEFRC